MMSLCLKCKGKGLCGKNCPLLSSTKPKIKLTKEFFGPSTSIFVGKFGYPNVFVGPMAVIDDSKLDIIDSPHKWFGQEYSQIIELRSLTLRSKFTQNIFSKSRFIRETQELALASRPTDVELNFKNKPKYNFSFSDINHPMGPSAQLEKLRVTENVKISQRVDKVISDDLKAADACYLLYQNKQDIYKIITILSSGAIGLGDTRKLVPSRWSTTCVDDIISKKLMEKIRIYSSINEFRVYESHFLDNHFLILLMPGNWEFENFEAWFPGSFWSQSFKPEIIEDYELFTGRKSYSIQSGGYYSTRFSICKYLDEIKHQARVVVFREISKGYVVPLGVFVVREAAYNALKQSYHRFDELSSALKYIGSRLRLPIKEYIKKSMILNQKRLNEFINN